MINELRAAERFAETATRTEEKRPGGKGQEVTANGGKFRVVVVVCCCLVNGTVIFLVFGCIWMYSLI